jgi:hypothetical protein
VRQPPSVGPLLGRLQGRRRQAEPADLFLGERDRDHLEREGGEEQVPERHQLARDRYRHLIPRRVEVGEDEDDHRPPVLGAGLGHSVELAVGDLAARQVEVGAVALAQRLGDFGEAGLLAVDHASTAIRASSRPLPAAVMAGLPARAGR